MAGLPLGWEWDYDGTRWFYKYKPTGHIQYHFPSEGDEFPDFIEAGAPAPDLAPEERLESQQQVKRQTSTSAVPTLGTRHGESNGSARANKNGMSATAKPISAVWEGDNENDEEGPFQPENFMFLGPGTYVDVSPLAEEEEEAAKRVVVGGIDGAAVSPSPPASGAATAAALAKGVSPVASGGTTPMAAKSELSVSTSPGPGASLSPAKNAASLAVESPPVLQSEPITSPPVTDAAATVGTTSSEAVPGPVEAPTTDQEHAQMIDSREMPVEMLGDTSHRFDPVGFMAEMPTEHTATAHIELHPDPVEIADNSVLAPIETAMTAAMADMAELPSKTGTTETQKVNDQETTGTDMLGGAVANTDTNATNDTTQEKQVQAKNETPVAKHLNDDAVVLTAPEQKKVDSDLPPSKDLDGDRRNDETAETSKPIMAAAGAAVAGAAGAAILTKAVEGHEKPNETVVDKSQDTLANVHVQSKPADEPSKQDVTKLESPRAVEPQTVPQVQQQQLDQHQVQQPPIQQQPQQTSQPTSVQFSQRHQEQPQPQPQAQQQVETGTPPPQDQPVRPAEAPRQESFKIARKQPGTPQPTYQAYVPGKSTPGATRFSSSSDKRNSIGAAPRAEPLMMNTPPQLSSTPGSNPIPRALSPPQNQQAQAQSQSGMDQLAWPTQSAQTSGAAAGKPLVLKPKPDYPEEESSQVPAALQPANRNSMQGLPPQTQMQSQPAAQPRVAEAQPQASSTSLSPPIVEEQQQETSNAGVSKFPSVLRPAGGRIGRQPGQQAFASNQSPSPLSSAGNTPQVPAIPSPPQQPGQQQSSQGPLHQPYGPLQGIQPARPASAMPALTHAPYGSKYATANQASTADQQIHPRQIDTQTSLSSNPLQAPPPVQHVQNAAAGQPVRPQSVIGIMPAAATGNPIQPTAPPAQPQQQQPLQQRQDQSVQSPPPAPGVRRVSTLGEEISPIRSRSESQSTGVNGPGYTPSPLTDTAGPTVRKNSNTSMGQAGGQYPPVPAKIREHVEGSFFPDQNAPDKSSPAPPPKEAITQPPAPAAPKPAAEVDRSSEYPIGYQVRAPPAQAQNRPSNQQQQQPQQQASTPAAHLLGRIEEHDETQQPPKPTQSPQLTRPSSVASSLQQTPAPSTPASSHGPKLHQPTPVAPVQAQAALRTGQPPMGAPPQGTPQGMLPSGQGPPNQMMHGQMLGQMPPAPGQPPHGQFAPGQQPPQGFMPQQAPMNPNMPQQMGQPGLTGQPGLVPAQPIQLGTKTKENRWAKWFKGNKPSQPQPQPVPQQFMPQTSGPIPGPIQNQQWTGGPYSPSHIRPPGQQGPLPMGGPPPPGFQQQGMQQQQFSSSPAPMSQHSKQSASDTASISTVGSGGRHPQGAIARQQSPGQAPPGPFPPGQVPQGQQQPPPGQFRPGQFQPNQPLPNQLPQGMMPQGQFAHGQPPRGQQMAQGPPQPVPGGRPVSMMSQSSGLNGHSGPGSVPPPQNPGMFQHTRTSSNTSVPQQMVPQQQMPPQNHMQQHYGNAGKQPGPNVAPTPLFANSNANRTSIGHQGQLGQPQQAVQQPGAAQWSQKPAGDYSGGGWGEEENWDRR